MLTVVVILVTVLIASNLTLNRIEKETRRNLTDTLRTVLSTTREGLSNWVADIRGVASHWSDYPEIRTRTAALLAGNREHASDSKNPDAVAIRRLLQPVLGTEGYIGFSLVSATSRKVVLGTFDPMIGKPHSLNKKPRDHGRDF